MPTKRSIYGLVSNGRLLAVSLLLFAGLLGQTACTRDEVAAAVATVAVQLEATLEPWGATAVANAQTLPTRIPAAIATAKAQPQPTSIDVSPTQLPPAGATPLPSATTLPVATMLPTATVLPTNTDAPTATPVPTQTAVPTEPNTATPLPTVTLTPSPTSTPYPERVEVPGGAMILIPGGYFQMGATAASLAEECAAFREGCQTEWFTASEPVHTVLLGRYYIDANEVTNEAYAAFLNELGPEPMCAGQPCLDAGQSQIILQEGAFSPPADAGLPATGVTWYGAAAFCAWRGGRLPSEAEWEKAAAWHPDSATARRYPWGDAFDGTALNFCDASCTEPQANPDFDDGFAELAPVASFENGRSAAGLYDMAGNVWEWVADIYAANYYTQSPAANPTGPETGEERVVRGGSWFDTANFMAAAIRFPSAPENADRTIGFRCAADTP